MPLPKKPTTMGATLNEKEMRSTHQTMSQPKKPVSSENAIIKTQAQTPISKPSRLKKKLIDTTRQSPLSRVASQTGQKKLFVLDTNVLMIDPTCLFRFDEHDIYIPMPVLEELDNHKTGLSDIARNVRQVSRTLDLLISQTSATHLTQGIPLNSLGHKEATGLLFIQTTDTPTALPPFLPKNTGDNQILSCVISLLQSKKTQQIVLVSKDINMRIKACALGIAAEDYFNDQVLDDIDLLYDGMWQLPDDFWEKHAKNLKTFTQKTIDGTVETYYNLVKHKNNVATLNQFVYYEPISGETPFYAQVKEINTKNWKLKVLFDYTKHGVWGTFARNREQNFALNALMDSEIDLVTLVGQAGTGKTLLALAAGLTQVLDLKRFSEVIVTRATIAVGEDIGYLPGTEEEKMSPWMGALDDNLEVLSQFDKKTNDWEQSTSINWIRNYISIKSLSFMRGRTFVNKFVIIDEAQNLTPKQMKTLITRAGPGTKIVCLGNLSQIDTPYLTEGSSGLTYLVDRFKGWAHAAHVMLSRGERSRLADFASTTL